MNKSNSTSQTKPIIGLQHHRMRIFVETYLQCLTSGPSRLNPAVEAEKALLAFDKQFLQRQRPSDINRNE